MAKLFTLFGMACYITRRSRQSVVQFNTLDRSPIGLGVTHDILILCGITGYVSRRSGQHVVQSYTSDHPAMGDGVIRELLTLFGIAWSEQRFAQCNTSDHHPAMWEGVTREHLTQFGMARCIATRSGQTVAKCNALNGLAK